MRILFLSHYFPPEVNAPATRTYEHCKEWVNLGHEVTVLSCVPHHPMGKVYPGYRNRLYQVEEKDGIRAVKVLTFVTANEGFFKRTLNYTFYMLMAIVVAPFLGKYDLVISTSPQFFNGMAGYFVSRLKSAPWILEIRDLWPESIISVGAIRNRRLIATLEWLEEFAYRKADFVVPVTNAFRRHILERGGREDRIKVIRNGVDLELFQPMARDEALAREWGLEDKFIAAYVGTHGLAHGLDTILDAAEILRDREDILFLTIGEGAEYARLKNEVEGRGLANVRMLGQQPKELMPKFWSISDCSLVLLRNLELFTTVIPSKIFESMAMKKPIVLGVKGEVREIIEEAGCGICMEPENSQMLAEIVARMADNPLDTIRLGEKGEDYVKTYFDRRALANKFAVLFNQIRR